MKHEYHFKCLLCSPFFLSLLLSNLIIFLWMLHTKANDNETSKSHTTQLWWAWSLLFNSFYSLFSLLCSLPFSFSRNVLSNKRVERGTTIMFFGVLLIDTMYTGKYWRFSFNLLSKNWASPLCWDFGFYKMSNEKETHVCDPIWKIILWSCASVIRGLHSSVDTYRGTHKTACNKFHEKNNNMNKYGTCNLFENKF